MNRQQLYIYKSPESSCNLMEANKIHARVILEMLGAPKDYIEQTMKNYVAKLKKEGITITKEHYEEAQPADKLFSTFAELEITFKHLQELLSFCFAALPSSVEILEPATLTLSAPTLTGFLNDLQARLHDADMIIKSVRAQSKILDNNATAVFQNFIINLVKQQPQTKETLSTIVGVEQKELEPFLKKLIETKKIIFNGTHYLPS